MNYHSNARLTLQGRERLAKAVIEEGWTLKKAAAFFRVSEPTVAKWAGRYRNEGLEGLKDRSSRPHHSPRRTPSAQEAVVLSLRRLRMPGFQIARQSGLSKPTVSRILQRHGLNSLTSLDPSPAVVRYEREHPGELLHIDIKKLGRIVRPGHRVTGNPKDHVSGAGWEYVHVAIDDASRIAYAEIMPDEKHQSVEIFLKKALSYSASLGIKVERLMSDNGPAYRSRPIAQMLRKLGIRHIFTKPYTPKTNGKAERFIQTSLREWAYAAVYQNSDHRQSHLNPWLHRYNWHRPHCALKLKTPIQRLNLPLNNLLSLHI
jgi:transposase InsO family protein